MPAPFGPVSDIISLFGSSVDFFIHSPILGSALINPVIDIINMSWYNIWSTVPMEERRDDKGKYFLDV